MLRRDTLGAWRKYFCGCIASQRTTLDSLIFYLDIFFTERNVDIFITFIRVILQFLKFSLHELRNDLILPLYFILTLNFLLIFARSKFVSRLGHTRKTWSTCGIFRFWYSKWFQRSSVLTTE